MNTTLCNTLLPKGNNFCKNKANLLIEATTRTGVEYESYCCKMHIRKVCSNIIDKGDNIDGILENKNNNVFDFYSFQNIRGLPAEYYRQRPENIQPPAQEQIDEYLLYDALWEDFVFNPQPEPQPEPQQEPQPETQPVPQRQSESVTYSPVLNTDTLNACCICYSDTKDIFCSTNRHVICNDCFESYILSESNRQEFNGTISCPLKRMSQCDCSGFTINLIAKNVTDDTFTHYDKKRYDIKEKHTIDKVKETIENEIKQKQELNELEKAKQHIIENILTLKCPNCKKVYYDFEGCCSIKCNGCHTNFCAKCHVYYNSSSDISHRHVSNCVENGSRTGLFFSNQEIKNMQNKFRKKMLDNYLKSNPKKTTIMNMLKTELKDLGLVKK